MTGPSLDWEKLGRYLAGESSPDEAAELRRWLESHPAEARMLEALDGAIRHLRPAPVDVEGILRSVKSHLHAAPAKDSLSNPVRTIARPAIAIRLAAAAAVILIAGVAVWRLRPATTRASPDTAARVDSTGVGERRTVRLPDGSDVLLGPASRIIARGRDVSLAGEALFRVVHDASRPFTVRAGGAIVRDVGTEFAVRDERGGVRVVVSQGAVQLSGTRDSVVLARGDVGVLRGDTLAAQRGAATADDLAWTRGTLVFRDASFAQVAADLKRWYGVEVRVTDRALLHRHFTGSFTNEPAGRVLDVLALALGARVDRRADTAYIRGTASIR